MISPEKTFSVKRRIGVLSGISFIIGNIIGSGIFISPKGVYEGAGSVGFCLIIWTICGLIGIAGAFVYADLGLMIQKSGGDYVYLSRATGNFTAFMYIWVNILVIYPMGHVILSLTVGEYLTALLIDDDCGPREIIKRLIAAAVITSFTILNVASVNVVAKLQVCLMVVKVGALSVIIVAGISYAAIQGNFGNLQEGFQGTTLETSGVAAAFYSALWASSGWSHLNCSLEEVYRPKRTLPLSIFISAGTVLILYVLVNVSYFAVLTREEFLSSWAVGMTWEEKVMGGKSFLLTIVVVLSVFGTGQGVAFSSARLCYAASRDDTFPEVFSYIHIRTRIPSASVILTSGLAFLYLALPGNVGDNINVTGFIGSCFQVLGFISHIILSCRMKNVERPFKVPVVVSFIMALVFTYLFVAPLIGGKIEDYIFAIAFLGAGVIMYFPFVYFKCRLPLMDTLVGFMQLVLDIAPPDKYFDAEDDKKFIFRDNTASSVKNIMHKGRI